MSMNGVLEYKKIHNTKNVTSSDIAMTVILILIHFNSSSSSSSSSKSNSIRNKRLKLHDLLANHNNHDLHHQKLRMFVMFKLPNIIKVPDNTEMERECNKICTPIVKISNTTNSPPLQQQESFPSLSASSSISKARATNTRIYS